ncbi:ATP-binding cassette domain-containing protein [Anaerocolumna sp. AGMB13025]|uniref:ABC transporter ATP-binding protein n=1 Tax=Anaerocolumna sp. AGMB13025 TaxID=3039116 RepID=UPI00241D1EB1|nr:ATP-binding cassette domain-containing protein [Anaerocolumna sp. AGMB13025]WFR56225.1 ATP-binding cassette domain-containing protein [Anaerocolumna sp. AGMB13025]
MIEVKNLVKKYGDHLAVDNLSFTVEKGQILGFLGPNGAGKSTTMNIITGYISATEGSVVIDGHDIFDEPEEAKKRIGYLPELPPLYQDMTVREYLNFVADLKLVKRSEKSKMIHKIMGMAKITDVSERLIKQLSKGYKQRVGLAQAMVGFPDVLILDEPTVGLDPMQIIEIRDLIKKLSKEHTIILSSHILSEVSAICDTVMIINKGKLIVSDTPDNLSKHIGGSNGLHLLIKGTREKINEALSDIEDITKIEYETRTQDGTIKLTAYCNEDSDIREAVFYALCDAKCPILNMQSSNMSLEDIFLEVTQTRGKNKQAKAGVRKKFMPAKPEEETPLAGVAANTQNQENDNEEEN